jgi:hypothetical protein
VKETWRFGDGLDIGAGDLILDDEPGAMASLRASPP